MKRIAFGGSGVAFFLAIWATFGLAITPVVSPSAESGRVLKAAPGQLLGLSVTTGVATGYVLLFNAVAVPADGAVTPVKCYVVPASSTLSVGYPEKLSMSTGISISFSTTGCFTKTASATAFFSAQVD